MSADQSGSVSGFAPLRVRDFRLLFFGFGIGQALMPLQFMTQIFFVQEHAPDNVWLLLVGLIGTMRGLGALTFGLYGGALADRFDRRMLLMVTQSILLTTTLGLSVVMWLSDGGVVGFIIFFALTFAASGMFAIDAPTRLAIVPDLLGPRLTPAGISLNQAAGQVSMPVAIFAAGFVIDGLGFGGAYALSSLGHVVEIVAIVAMAYRTDLSGHDTTKSYGFKQTVSDVSDGIRYTRGQPTILWIIILMVAMMGLGFPATANLGPTWVTTVVGVPIRYMGFVAVTWGLGAFLAAALMARYASYERKGVLVAVGTTLFSMSFLVFVMMHTVPNAVVGNLGLGMGMSAATISAATLIQHLATNEMRGRVMSLFQLNMGFAQLMTLPIAALAQIVSLEVLFPILAVSVLSLVLLILLTQPRIWRARITHEPWPTPVTPEAAAGG